jgi:hypothetical protein
MKKKFYETQTFTMAICVALGIILYKIVSGIFF